MSKKNKDKIKIAFLGKNATQVTGSMILITTPKKQILLECGMIQSNKVENDYKDNSKSFPFKPKSIDYVFINHFHADHGLRTPKLIRDGFEGKIITTSITKALMKPMGLDSANIVRKDAEYMSKKRGKQIYPYYSEEDIYRMIELTEIYGYDEIYKLDNEISFRFLHNSHIIGACQLELFIKNESGYISKICYSSDLGRVNLKNHYVDDLEKCKNTTIFISECTYGATDKNIKQDRNKDLEKIKTSIEQVCNIQKGRILIPSFSLSRAQQILTDLYLIYSKDKSFTTPIIVDSPLIWEVNKVYHEMLEGEDKELFEKVCNWKNVRFIKDYKESKLCVEDSSSKIIIASSGFLNKGRSCNYAQSIIKTSKDHIIFVGYSPKESIAGKIKSGQKNINIDGKTFKNKCTCTILNSYSSHIQQKELLDYLKDVNCEKVYLVHSDIESKLEFKELLETEYRKMNKTTRIICTTKGTSCNL